jgi:hypothetical protein
VLGVVARGGADEGVAGVGVAVVGEAGIAYVSGSEGLRGTST